MKGLYTSLVIVLLSINVFGQSPNWEWAKNSSGTNGNLGSSIAVDGNGNSYVVGSFSCPTISFGTYTLTNADTSIGFTDNFIVKYDINGNVQWAHRSGGTYEDSCTSIVTDVNGNSYISGYFFSSSITFGSTTLINTDISGNTPNIFIVKYDSNGNVLWANSPIGGGWVNSIVLDAAGNFYVTGCFRSSTIILGTTTLVNFDNTGSTEDLFIAKYDTNGNNIWANSAGGNWNEEGYCISVDDIGNTYITGYFWSATLTIGATTLVNAGCCTMADMFVAKYDINGNPLWAKRAGGAIEEYGFGIAVDGIGNSYVIGRFASPSITFGSIVLLNSDNSGSTYDIFMTKYDTNGNVVWSKSAGGNYFHDEGFGIVLDANANIYVTGYFSSPFIMFGTNVLIRSGYQDIFITEYDNNGNNLWAKSASGINMDISNHIILDATGNSYITGFTGSPSMTFGSTTLTNVGVFVAKLNSSTVEVNKVPKDETGIYVFPNPFTSETTITFNEAGSTTQHNIKVMNTLGECIQQLTTSNKQLILDMSGYAKGVYFVRIESSFSLPLSDGETKPVYKKLVLQ